MTEDDQETTEIDISERESNSNSADGLNFSELSLNKMLSSLRNSKDIKVKDSNTVIMTVGDQWGGSGLENEQHLKGELENQLKKVSGDKDLNTQVLKSFGGRVCCAKDAFIAAGLGDFLQDEKAVKDTDAWEREDLLRGRKDKSAVDPDNFTDTGSKGGKRWR